VATLVVDCGGLGLKAAIFDDAGLQVGDRTRRDTPYPLSPLKLADTIAELGASSDLKITQVTVGMPGMIRHGKVIHTPHYITTSGPHSAIDPDLAEQWANCDIQSLLAARLGVPTIVMNDAELHGLGVITGQGSELVLTFGTGLGTAWFDEGALAPHLEISHAPVRIGEMVLGRGRRTSLTYDRYIGDKELRRLGADHWSDRVLAVVDSLRPVFHWDRLFIGGGNAQRIAPWAKSRLADDVIIVPNEAALTGGLKVWNSVTPDS